MTVLNDTSAKIRSSALQRRTSHQIQKLLSQLIESLSQSDPTIQASSVAGGDREVLLEIELDQAQYTLLRTRTDQPTTCLRLSPREKEVVCLIAQGFPNKAIAHRLDISPWTVDTYVKRIFAKFNISSRAEMVARAMEAGLIG